MNKKYNGWPGTSVLLLFSFLFECSHPSSNEVLIASIDGKIKSGVIDPSTLRTVKRIVILSRDGSELSGYRVISFEFVRWSSVEQPSTIQNEGAAFNKRIIEVLGNLASNDSIVFRKLSISSTSEGRRTLEPIVLSVK
jgi:hypothetical protein